MSRIKIYTTMLCPSCHVAKQLLKKKDAVIEEIDVSFQPQKRAKMSSLAGGRASVPQIWIGDRHIGGCDELLELEQRGKLDALLAVTAE